jgi:hypothetical protein
LMWPSVGCHFLVACRLHFEKRSFTTWLCV